MDHTMHVPFSRYAELLKAEKLLQTLMEIRPTDPDGSTTLELLDVMMKGEKSKDAQPSMFDGKIGP